MARLSVETYVALLWGISVLFAVESMSASISTVEPRKPAEIGVSAPAQTTVPPAVETAEAVVTHGSDGASDLVAKNTVAATTGSRDPSHNATKPGEDQIHRGQPSTAPTDMAAAATVAVSSPQLTSTAEPEATSQFSSTTSPAHAAPGSAAFQTTSGPSASTTPTMTKKTSISVFDSTISETSTGTGTPTSTSQSHDTAEPSTISLSTHSPISTLDVSTTTTDVSTTPDVSTITTNVSTTTDVSITPDVSTITTNVSTTTDVSITTNVSTTTDVSITTDVSTTPDVSTITTDVTTTPDVSTTTNVSTPVVSTTDISTTPDVSTTTNVSTPVVSTTDISTSPDVSTTTDVFTTTNVSTTTDVFTTTDVSNTTNVTTSPAGILIPHVPTPTTKSTPPTTTVSKSPPSTDVQTCSTRGVVKNCLIVIASLAALATIFMVSTIALCTKLSTRKYKVRNPQPATEMMCISALLPERSHAAYTRQRNPVSNGVLVIHSGADSDEDIGDNLTLSSFLPENDRFL